MRRILSNLSRILGPFLGIGQLASTGLHNIDLQLFSIMNRKRRGYFIEVGANDGITQSNSYMLEKAYGWTGLLIEPLPHLAENCRKIRGRSKVHNLALVSRAFPDDAVFIEDANQMSVIRDGSLPVQWADDHVAKGVRCQGMGKSSLIRVPAATLDSILLAEKVIDVDFFSLDVEGYELNVLEGLTLSNFNIKNIFVETRRGNEKEIDVYLKDNRYVNDYSWITPDYTNKLYQLQD